MEADSSFDIDLLTCTGNDAIDTLRRNLAKEKMRTATLERKHLNGMENARKELRSIKEELAETMRQIESINKGTPRETKKDEAKVSRKKVDQRPDMAEFPRYEPKPECATTPTVASSATAAAAVVDASPRLQVLGTRTTVAPSVSPSNGIRNQFWKQHKDSDLYEVRVSPHALPTTGISPRLATASPLGASLGAQATTFSCPTTTFGVPLGLHMPMPPRVAGTLPISATVTSVSPLTGSTLPPNFGAPQLFTTTQLPQYQPSAGSQPSITTSYQQQWPPASTAETSQPLQPQPQPSRKHEDNDAPPAVSIGLFAPPKTASADQTPSSKTSKPGAEWVVSSSGQEY